MADLVLLDLGVHLVTQVLRDQRAARVNKDGLVSKDVQVLKGLQGYMGG